MAEARTQKTAGVITMSVPLRRQKSILCWTREIKFSLHTMVLYEKQVFSHLRVIGRFSFPSVPLIDNTVQSTLQTESVFR